MSKADANIDTVRASRAGHTFHERWAARRALQLIFPNDDLTAIAVEGISSTEPESPGAAAEEVADLVLYYGGGDNFASCKRLETVQFKYKIRDEEVTASYLKKTIEKFASTICGYDKLSSAVEVDEKIRFIFVTNATFKENLSDAINCLISGSAPLSQDSAEQIRYLREYCDNGGLSDAGRLFSKIVFRAGEMCLSSQNSALKRVLTDWSAGADGDARIRLLGLQDLVLKKAGPSGQGKNLIRREDVLDALECEPEDLFPADARFIDVGAVVERSELAMVYDLVKASDRPIFVDAEGGVGKTVFVQSLASTVAKEFEVILFDCFGGGSYRSDNHSRHLPRIGLVQIVNELAARTLCDPLLPSGDDSRKIVKAARKRLEQAAKAIRAQSGKQGLLIVVDAADNAQLEAEHRHEESFPRLLLSTISEEQIEGVKLLLTARTHRKDAVIGGSNVIRVELGPFGDSEAREFLKNRKPDATGVEQATALARSGRNARVLDYLVRTWEENVAGERITSSISVPEIIAQRCAKIIKDLHTAGWSESEITEFFVALSLLPPPIPLDELARALDWSAAHVGTAASDLAPMLEVTSHGAIFRDEPTETYIRETYSHGIEAQKAIADRLLAAQGTSAYAAEALPHFLVVIKDSDRAFALADSTSFPSSIQSEFGRQRLTLARLRAAFRLAVAEDDFDRVLGLSMRLAQTTMANSRGDKFIRNSPGLAIVLGDSDSYRRLLADRSGWRGARSARLAIAHSFAGDAEEAEIQCESAIRWINWSAGQADDGAGHNRAGPGIRDFAAVLFQQAAEGRFDSVDRNLASWSDQFSLSASGKLLGLLELFDESNGTTLVANLVSFAASEKCKSRALKLRVLAWAHGINRRQVKDLAKGIEGFAVTEDRPSYEPAIASKDRVSDLAVNAALTALLLSSRAAAAAIVKCTPAYRPSAYDFGERYGHSDAWSPIFRACVRAWASGKRVAYHDLLPNEIRVSKEAKAITAESELKAFLKKLRSPSRGFSEAKSRSSKEVARYTDRECDDISGGIATVQRLILPMEEAVLSRKGMSEATVTKFLEVWKKLSREGVHWRSETAKDLLVRTVGLGCVQILLDRSPTISMEQAKEITAIISAGRFSVQEKISVLGRLARIPALHEVAGQFAQHVSEQIGKDEDVEQRGAAYSNLAACLVHMSKDEARTYYCQGLAQLDQMGGESYDEIYSLLKFACVQRGGFLRPALSQRLMNLCQIIAASDPRKFSWTLFARAAANSVGISAIAKILRWHDQDVADKSYGLPQLACFLAKNGHLDSRRAAILLNLCEDHGWWDWNRGEGVADLLKVSDPADRRPIFNAVVENARAQHPHGAWPSFWDGFLEAGKQFSNLLTDDEREEIGNFRSEAQRRQEDADSRDRTPPEIRHSVVKRLSEAEVNNIVIGIALSCDPSSSLSIDNSLAAIASDDRLSYDARQRFITELRSSCRYDKRLAFLSAICDSVELSLSQSLDIIAESLSEWKASSKHLAENTRALVERLFESKVGELFESQYPNIVGGINRLSDLCGDRGFVLRLVLRKVAADEVDLGSDEWLQLTTALCDVASGKAGLDALELLLSGPASRIADEIGEGPLRPEQEISGSERMFFSDVIWHLLGDEDAYVRWTVARELNTLVDIGAGDDLQLLLDRFDLREVAALASPDRRLSFQNSQQWLLIGLGRVALRKGRSLNGLRGRLLALAQRSDIHVLDKVFIARCLRNIDAEDVKDAAVEALVVQTDQPQCGIVINDAYPAAATSTSTFSFDYEFAKYEINALARLFNVAQPTVEEAIATEITSLFPGATSLNEFPGRQSYRWDRDDRFESYREHIQRHALLGAATKLSTKLPVAIRSYEEGGGSPWLEWRNRYDITFDDGAWLSDRKDAVPVQAKEELLGARVGQQETLKSYEVLLKKLGFDDVASEAQIPLYGRWSSPDGVGVRITSALTERVGAVGRCKEFSKLFSHDLWLPEFWEDGYYDETYRQKNVFSPFVWAPETHSLGIDVGDELAAEGPAGRPRLGIEYTNSLMLTNKLYSGVWLDADERLALRSQVWGNWKAESGQRGSRFHDDGALLLASQDWLSETLSTLKRKLVFTITLWKYRSSSEYSPSTGVKCVLVGLRGEDGAIRLWHAKAASKQDN